MNWFSLLAIFLLFWFLCLFLVLPFRLRSNDAAEAPVPGQAESAPPGFSFGRTVKWTTLLALAMTGLYWANYVNGWLTTDMLDLVRL